MTHTETTRCRYSIEKRYPGRRYVEWRRQCRNRTKHPSGYCHIHKAWRPRDTTFCGGQVGTNVVEEYLGDEEV